MRIGIFVSPGNETSAKRLLRLLHDASIDTAAYQIRNNWDTLDLDQIRISFGTISHILIEYEHSMRTAGWVPLLVGYAIGKGCSLALYRNGGAPNGELPIYLQRIDAMSSAEKLIEYYRQEQRVWDENAKVEEAEVRIRTRGLGLSDDVLASCVNDGDLEGVEDFLTIGFSPDTRDSKGVPLVCSAIRAHQREIVAVLLDRGADVNAMSEDRGNTPLMEASVRGDTEVVEKLLDAGADVNLLSKNGQTALMLAVGEGFADVVRHLMHRGADTAPVDQLGMTAMKYAELFRHEVIQELLAGE